MLVWTDCVNQLINNGREGSVSILSTYGIGSNIYEKKSKSIIQDTYTNSIDNPVRHLGQRQVLVLLLYV